MSSWILLPPGCLLLLLALAAVVAPWRRGLARLLVVASGALLYLSSIPVVAAALLGALQVHDSPPPSAIDAFRSEAIVVLAAGRRSTAPEYGGETVGTLTLERIRYAARLHRQTGLPVYVAGGDPASDGVPLAELMRVALADDYGIAVAGLETMSDTTAENAEYLAPVLARRGIDRILLVTHSWHMPRAKRAFERQGLAVLPAPTAFIGTGDTPALGDFLPTADALRGTAFALHEILGYLWYELRYGAP